MFTLSAAFLALAATLVGAVPAPALPVRSQNVSPTANVEGGLVLSERNTTAVETLEKRGAPGFYICLNTNFDKPCFYQPDVTPGDCYNTAGTYVNQISSFGPDTGLKCWGFRTRDCTSDAIGPIQYPGIDTVSEFQHNGINFHDNINSIQCYKS